MRITLREQLEHLQHDMRLQVIRTAELQADMDALLTALKASRTRVFVPAPAGNGDGPALARTP